MDNLSRLPIFQNNKNSKNKKGNKRQLNSNQTSSALNFNTGSDGIGNSPPNKTTRSDDQQTSSQVSIAPCSFSTDGKDLNDFLGKLLNVDQLANSILPTVQTAELKVVLQQLAGLTKACGYLLSREISVNLSNALEAERRAHSLVLSNLPESASASPTQRAKDDHQKVLEVLDAVDVEAIPVTYRMGKYNPEGRPRLVKIELPTKKHVVVALRNRSKLQLSANFKNSYLRMSQTEEERQKYRELVKQRNELNDNLPLNEKQDNRYVVYALQLYRAQELNAMKKERRKLISG